LETSTATLSRKTVNHKTKIREWNFREFPAREQIAAKPREKTEIKSPNIRDEVRQSLFAPEEISPDLSRESIAAEAKFYADNWAVKKEIYRGETFDNAKTAIMEALSASGHLSQMEYRGTVDEIATILIQRAVNYLSLPLHPHERERAIAELREAVLVRRVARQIRDGVLAPTVNIAMTSLFPDDLDAETATKIGYRATNKKGMLRNWSFENFANGEIGVKLDQLSFTNLGDLVWRTPDFREPDFALPADLYLLNHSELYDARFMPDAVVDYARALDFGSGKRYGETISSRTLDYADLRRESAEREKRIEYFYQELADFQRDFPDDRQGYCDKVQEIAARICIQAPTYAAATFGENSVAIFEQANAQAVRGDYAGAFATVAGGAQSFDVVVICGGSSSQAVELTISQQAQLAQMSESEKAEFIAKIKRDSEKLQWRSGYCRVENCPGHKNLTEVGPCEICKACQKLFADNGDDYAKVVAANAKLYGEKNREKPREKSDKSEKIRRFGAKVLNNIRRFIWGDGIFASVERAEFYGGEIVDDAATARAMYREKYDLTG